MNVLLAFDSNYLMSARVLMHSLLLHNPCNVTVYILYSHLTQEELDLIAADVAQSGHAQAVLIAVPPDAFSDAPLHCKWISVETYYRLLAQELLPQEVDRLLYLDADTVVLGSLEEFYHTDFEGKLLVACSEGKPGEFDPKALEQRTLPPDTVYFSAGVLLYDLAAQRKEIEPSIFHDYPAMFYDRLPYGDQDVLNAVFYRQTKYADFCVYNLPDIHTAEVAPAGRDALVRNCLIFHFCGFGKPWTYQYWGEYSRLFWRYAVDFPEYAPLMDGMLLAQKQYAADRKKREQHKKLEKEKSEQEKEGTICN